MILPGIYLKRFEDITLRLNAAWQDYARSQMVVNQCITELSTLIFELTTPTPGELREMRK